MAVFQVLVDCCVLFRIAPAKLHEAGPKADNISLLEWRVRRGIEEDVMRPHPLLNLLRRIGEGASPRGERPCFWGLSLGVVDGAKSPPWSPSSPSASTCTVTSVGEEVGLGMYVLRPLYSVCLCGSLGSRHETSTQVVFLSVSKCCCVFQNSGHPNPRLSVTALTTK